MNAARDQGVEDLRVLVTVKTYPQPSTSYQETVCTAGITEDGRWIRLYPIPFRYWDEQQQFSLYDWIQVKAQKRPLHKDKRKESYQPVGVIRIVDHVGPQHDWEERKRLILPYARTSVEELLARYEEDGESLGLIRPAEVLGVKVERDAGDWTSAQKRVLLQTRMFGPQPRPLAKLPVKFSYRFKCDDPRCNGHTMQITDWGLYVLFLKLCRDEGKAAAIAKTRQRCEEVVGPGSDAYLYLGTVWPKPSFIVIGMFYPKTQPRDGRLALPLG